MKITMAMSKSEFADTLKAKLALINGYKIPDNIGKNLVRISEFHELVKGYCNSVDSLSQTEVFDPYWDKIANQHFAYNWLSEFLQNTDINCGRGIAFISVPEIHFKNRRNGRMTILKEEEDLTKAVEKAIQMANQLHVEVMQHLTVIRSDDLFPRRVSQTKKTDQKRLVVFGDIAIDKKTFDIKINGKTIYFEKLREKKDSHSKIAVAVLFVLLEQREAYKSQRGFVAKVLDTAKQNALLDRVQPVDHQLRAYQERCSEYLTKTRKFLRDNFSKCKIPALNTSNKEIKLVC